MPVSKNRRKHRQPTRQATPNQAPPTKTAQTIAEMATDAIDNSPVQARPRGRPSRTAPAALAFTMRLEQPHLDALERIAPYQPRAKAIRTAIERADAPPRPAKATPKIDGDSQAQDPGQLLMFGDDALDLLHTIQADLDRIIKHLFANQQDGYVDDED